MRSDKTSYNLEVIRGLGSEGTSYRTFCSLIHKVER